MQQQRGHACKTAVLWPPCIQAGICIGTTACSCSRAAWTFQGKAQQLLCTVQLSFGVLLAAGGCQRKRPTGSLCLCKGRRWFLRGAHFHVSTMGWLWDGMCLLCGVGSECFRLDCVVELCVGCGVSIRTAATGLQQSKHGLVT